MLPDIDSNKTDWSVYELPLDSAASKELLGMQNNLAASKTSARRSREFFAGPVDMEWLYKAAKLKGASLQVALMICHLRKLRGLEWVPLSNCAMERMRVSPDAKSRAIAALENAGLIMVKRQVGKSPRIKVIEFA